MCLVMGFGAKRRLRRVWSRLRAAAVANLLGASYAAFQSARRIQYLARYTFVGPLASTIDARPVLVVSASEVDLNPRRALIVAST